MTEDGRQPLPPELGALARRVDTGREGHGRADKPAPNRRFSNVRLRRRFFQPEQGVSAQTLLAARGR